MLRPWFALLVAAAMFVAQPATAGSGDNGNGKAHGHAKGRVVHGVALASLCKGCGVVAKEQTETRKGQASGVGAVGGAVAGGVVGNQFGRGDGKTAMTVVGAVGGAVAGNQIEKNMKKHTVWITTVTFKDGTEKRFERGSDPGLRAGDVVKIVNGQPVRRGS
jgi:outer membrane lipoprotein SlyB